MNDTRRTFTRLGRPLTALLAACALAGCGLMPDVTTIRNAAADARPGADPSLARCRNHIVVDGQDHVHGLLDRPAMQLFHRGRGRMMTTAEADGQGRFVWTLPVGDYGVLSSPFRLIRPKPPKRP